MHTQSPKRWSNDHPLISEATTEFWGWPNNGKTCQDSLREDPQFGMLPNWASNVRCGEVNEVVGGLLVPGVFFDRWKNPSQTQLPHKGDGSPISLKTILRISKIFEKWCFVIQTYLDISKSKPPVVCLNLLSKMFELFGDTFSPSKICDLAVWYTASHAPLAFPWITMSSFCCRRFLRCRHVRCWCLGLCQLCNWNGSEPCNKAVKASTVEYL